MDFFFFFFHILFNVNNGIVQIFRGLAYIHSVPGVCHRDLKPQNLLVCSLLIISWRKKLWLTRRNLSSQYLCACTMSTYYIRFFNYNLWLFFWSFLVLYRLIPLLTKLSSAISEVQKCWYADILLSTIPYYNCFLPFLLSWYVSYL